MRPPPLRIASGSDKLWRGPKRSRIRAGRRGVPRGAAMAVGAIDVTDRIVEFKRKMSPRRDALNRAYASITDHVRRASEVILTEVAAGRPVIPEVEYADIRD